ncbi:MAG: GDP-mannose 4,6-dehydratase [Nanoarchaeota archaeon]
MILKNKKIFITGGAGFLGSNLARRLIDKNEVSLFVKPNTDLWRIEDIKSHKNIKIIEGNLLDYELIKDSILNIDYLYHFAWQTDLKKSMENPSDDLKNDILGLVNILEICKKYNPKIKIIFASTVTVIGSTKNIPCNEDERENPLSSYDINKLMAEKYIKMYHEKYGIKSCILRLSNVFGEYQKIDNPNRGILNFMIGKALRNEDLTIYGKGDFIRDYSYVQNYIDAFILAAESEKTNGEIFVLGSGEGKTFLEVVEKIKKIVENLTNKKLVIKYLPFPKGYDEINKRNFIADYLKFNKTVNWKPKINFEEGLKKTIEFYIYRI